MYIRSKDVRRTLRIIGWLCYIAIAIPVVSIHIWIPYKYPAETRAAAFKALVLEQKVLTIPTETALHKRLPPKLTGT